MLQKILDKYTFSEVNLSWIIGAGNMTRPDTNCWIRWILRAFIKDSFDLKSLRMGDCQSLGEKMQFKKCGERKELPTLFTPPSWHLVLLRTVSMHQQSILMHANASSLRGNYHNLQGTCKDLRGNRYKLMIILTKVIKD